MTPRPTARSTPSVPRAKLWAPLRLRVARFTQVASPVPCASPPRIGRASTPFISVAVPPMQPVPASTTPFSTRNSEKTPPSASCPPPNCSATKPGPASPPGLNRRTKSNIELLRNDPNRSPTPNKPIAHPTLHALTSKTHKLSWELALNAPFGSLFHHPGLERLAGNGAPGRAEESHDREAPRFDSPGRKSRRPDRMSPGDLQRPILLCRAIRQMV